MTVFAIIGIIVTIIVTLAALYLAAIIAGNIYGGIKGAYRYREIVRRGYGKNIPHTKTIKYGLGAWFGARYTNGTGYYWQMGAMRVPRDGRDKITRDRYFS